MIHKPVFIAAIVVMALLLWMLSGTLGNTPDVSLHQKTTATDKTDLVAVRVREFSASDVARVIAISGSTSPSRAVTTRSEIDARVVSIAARRGSILSKGDLLLRLDLRQREAERSEYRAAREQRRLEYVAASKLLGKGLLSDVELAQKLASLEQAKARLKAIEVDIASATLHAPFDSVLQDRMVEIGDYVKKGDVIARIVDLDPMLVVGEVNEKEVGVLHIGMTGSAVLATGEVVQGTVHYIAAESHQQTRTFQVELLVPNPSGELKAGVTAEIQLSVPAASAHYLSPSLLSLTREGSIGVKTVGRGDRVEIHPVKIIRATAEGIYVSGLPATVRIITVGQGYVHPGQQVRPVTEQDVKRNGAG